jgi:hypothetical protein
MSFDDMLKANGLPAGGRRVTIEQAPAAVKWRAVAFARSDGSNVDTCFGCMYGGAGVKDNVTLNGLHLLFTDNFGVVSNAALASLMSEYYTQHVVTTLQNAPPWPVAAIIEHIEQHMIEPTVVACTAIQNLREIERMLLDEIRLVDDGKDGKEKKIDHKTLKSLLDVQRQIMAWFNSRPTKQLFYDETLSLDKRREHQS